MVNSNTVDLYMNWYKRHFAAQAKGQLFVWLNNPAVKQAICAAVQKVYNEWQQDPNEGDPELGFGGICNDVANEIISTLTSMSNGTFEVKSYGAEEDHTATLVWNNTECYYVDVHWTHYERNLGMYNYRKIEDVVINPNMVTIAPEERGFIDFDD